MSRDGTGLRSLSAALLAALAAAACGGGGGPDKTLEQVSSWAATAQLAARDRARGATSARYTQNVLHAAHAELLQNVKALTTALDSSKDSSKLAPPLRVRAKAAAADVEEAVADMTRQAERYPEDVAALLRIATRLTEPGETAQALADSAKQQQQQ
jgi:hypothetical protein